MNDNLPDIEDLSALAANPPPLAQEIIEGILRTGHKLLLAGPSKAGKSFTLMHLCLALGNGETCARRVNATVRNDGTVINAVKV